MEKRKTTELERIERKLVQAEQFLHFGLKGDAMARARQAIASVERALSRTSSDAESAALTSRRFLAEDLVGRAGGTVRHRGALQVSRHEAVPETWF